MQRKSTLAVAGVGVGVTAAAAESGGGGWGGARMYRLRRCYRQYRSRRYRTWIWHLAAARGCLRRSMRIGAGRGEGEDPLLNFGILNTRMSACPHSSTKLGHLPGVNAQNERRAACSSMAVACASAVRGSADTTAGTTAGTTTGTTAVSAHLRDIVLRCRRARGIDAAGS